MWGEIINPFPDFTGTSIDVLGCMIILSHIILGVWLLIHAWIKDKLCYRKGTQVISHLAQIYVGSLQVVPFSISSSIYCYTMYTFFNQNGILFCKICFYVWSWSIRKKISLFTRTRACTNHAFDVEERNDCLLIVHRRHSQLNQIAIIISTALFLMEARNVYPPTDVYIIEMLH